MPPRRSLFARLVGRSVVATAVVVLLATIAALAWLVGSCVTAEAATYYIHGRYPWASNTATGQSFHAAGADTPWRSINKANGVLTAGDTVIILTLNPVDSANACGTWAGAGSAYSNCIDPANDGTGAAEGAGLIVYWGADTINTPPSPINLPVLTTSITKDYIVVRGLKLRRTVTIGGSTSGDSITKYVAIQACSLRTAEATGRLVMSGAQNCRIDSCSMRLQDRGACAGQTGSLQIDNASGDYYQPHSSQDTIRYSSIRIDSLRFNKWGIFLRDFTNNLWIHNNVIGLNFTPEAGSPCSGQRAAGIIHEESYETRWYNNTIAFRMVGVQGRSDIAHWMQRSGSRLCRMQGNTIYVGLDTPNESFEWNLSQHSGSPSGQPDGYGSYQIWLQFYGDILQNNRNSWIDNRVYMAAGGGMRWYMDADRDSFVGNIVAARNGTPLYVDQGIDINDVVIEHNTLYSATDHAFFMDKMGADCGVGATGRSFIRYNVFYTDSIVVTTSCGCDPQGEGCLDHVVYMRSMDPTYITWDYNLLWSRKGALSRAMSICGSCNGLSFLPNSRYIDPFFTNYFWMTTTPWTIPTLSTTTGAGVTFGPSTRGGTEAGYVGAVEHQRRPAAISDLTACCPTATSADVRFKAVGDDSLTGIATLYDLRYSTSAINESNWASATEYTNEPAPLLSGVVTAFTVEGLAPATTYYFAIKVQNAQGNYSALNTGATVTVTTIGGSGGESEP